MVDHACHMRPNFQMKNPSYVLKTQRTAKAASSDHSIFIQITIDSKADEPLSDTTTHGEIRIFLPTKKWLDEIQNAFAVVEVWLGPPGSIHGGRDHCCQQCRVLVDLSWKNLLLAVEPDSFHVTVNDDVCVICLWRVVWIRATFVVAIKKCNHMFHHNCFESYSNQTTLKRCPTCQVFCSARRQYAKRIYYGTPCGLLLTGGINLEGGSGCYIVPITVLPVEFGRQLTSVPWVPFMVHTDKHIIYQILLKVTRKGFECQSSTFTVGDSITSGAQNVAVWNNIHHKTTLHGGSFGYPDADYLSGSQRNCELWALLKI
ncbi:unnamed protein product, partial [Mesorhabditis belari]|uniref:E3 ubiquitin-protein ligase n=1 Tax=Mesorhabditis belari TaxID=2138241 RepID=A0AAF3FNW4_9BILA